MKWANAVPGRATAGRRRAPAAGGEVQAHPGRGLACIIHRECVIWTGALNANFFRTHVRKKGYRGTLTCDYDDVSFARPDVLDNAEHVTPPDSGVCVSNQAASEMRSIRRAATIAVVLIVALLLWGCAVWLVIETDAGEPRMADEILALALALTVTLLAAVAWGVRRLLAARAVGSAGPAGDGDAHPALWTEDHPDWSACYELGREVERKLHGG